MNQLQSLQGSAEAEPLWLSELTVRRFRCLHDVGPVPIQAALSVLTGENDGGKTTFLDAIEFLLGSRSLDTADRSCWSAEDEPIEVEGVFYSINDAASAMPLRMRAVQRHGASRVCEVLVSAHRHLGPQWQKLPIADLKEQMVELEIPLPKGTRKDLFISAVETWLLTQPAGEWEERWRPASREDVDRLPKLTRFRAIEAQNPIDMIKQVVARESRVLLGQPRYVDRLMELGKELDAEIAPNLARMRETIREHLPDLDDIEIFASFDFSKPIPQIRCEVSRQGGQFDLEKGGEGRRRRVALALYEATLSMMSEGGPLTTELITYDEPDTHLDIVGQRTLFDILDRQAQLGHVQVLVATHAKCFIDKVPLQALLHFRLDEELKSQVEALASYGHIQELAFLARVCAGIGLRNSVLLDERCFLVVEGDTEESAIPEIFRLVTGCSLLTAGINVMNTKGSGSIRSAVTTLAMDWGRDVVLLADTDTYGGTHQGGISERWLTDLGLEAGAGAYFVGSKEFEDAFADDVWLQALQAEFPPNDGGGNWRLEEIATLRDEPKFSTALLALVRRRCRISRGIGKPDLGFALAKVCSKREIPLIVQECMEYVRERAQL